MKRLLFAFLWVLLCSGMTFGQNNSALSAQALPGLNVQVRGGTILLASSSIGISNTTVALSNNTTNYVFLSSTGVVQTNTTGFTSTMLPIATVITAQGQIVLIQDNRPDFIFTGGGSGLPAGPTSPNVPFQLTCTPPAVCTPTWSFPGTTVQAQQTANFNFNTLAGQARTQIVPTCASGIITATIPDGGGTNFAFGYSTAIWNEVTASCPGPNGTVVLTRTSSSTINGGTVLPCYFHTECLIYLDSANNWLVTTVPTNATIVSGTGTTWWLYTFWAPIHTNSVAPVLVANQPGLFSFFLPFTAVITKATIYVGTGVAATTGDVGVYPFATSGTVNLLWHTGSFATTVTGVVGTAVSGGAVTMSPGQYFLATCDSNNTVLWSSSANSTPIEAIANAGPAHTWGTDATDTCTLGVLPPTITVTNITNSASTSFGPPNVLASN